MESLIILLSGFAVWLLILIWDQHRMNKKLNELEIALKKAKRNDNRDPKTGRYIKAK